MNSRWAFLILPLFAVTIPASQVDSVTIIDTGSTNRTGFQVTIEESGSARVQPRTGDVHDVKLDRAVSSRFVALVRSIGALHDLPAAHCMKSASFGSSLFVQVGDDRSPDLNCPVSNNPKLEDLRKQATDILDRAQAAAGLRTTRRASE